MSLKSKALNGVKWTSISTVLNASIQLLQISILARYLDKGDFGLWAIIMLIIGFSQMFVDFGISSAIIHKQSTTNEQLSTLYWLNILMSLIIYGIIVLLSPFIANFYNEVTLTNLINLTAIIVVIQSFGKQYFVLFEKNLQFNILAKIDIASNLIGFMLAILLAIYGYGVYSLIYPTILVVALKSLLYIINGIKYHRPKFIFALKDVKEYIRFGVFLLGSDMVNYFNSQFDVIVIGKVFGNETLGMYSIIKQLVMRPAQIINPIITRVTFPTMSKVQNDTEKLKNIYLKTINYLLSVNFPIYIAMIILAPEIITIFLGEKWLEAVEIFQLLSIYALIRSTGNPMGSLILAKGKSDYAFYWNIGLFFIIPITIYTGSFYGIEAVVWSMVGLQIFLKYFGWRFLVNKLCGAGLVEYLMEIFKPLFIASISGLIAYLSLYILKSDMIILNIITVCIVELIFVVLLNILFNKEFAKTILSMAKI